MDTEINTPAVTDEKKVTDVTHVKTPHDIVGEYFDEKAELQRYTRLHVNIDEETAEALRAMKGKRGATITEVVRRSILLAHFLHNELENGRRIESYDPRTQTVRSITFL